MIRVYRLGNDNRNSIGVNLQMIPAARRGGSGNQVEVCIGNEWIVLDRDWKDFIKEDCRRAGIEVEGEVS